MVRVCWCYLVDIMRRRRKQICRFFAVLLAVLSLSLAGDGRRYWVAVEPTTGMRWLEVVAAGDGELGFVIRMLSQGRKNSEQENIGCSRCHTQLSGIYTLLPQLSGNLHKGPLKPKMST